MESSFCFQLPTARLAVRSVSVLWYSSIQLFHPFFRPPCFQPLTAFSAVRFVMLS